MLHSRTQPYRQEVALERLKALAFVLFALNSNARWQPTRPGNAKLPIKSKAKLPHVIAQRTLERCFRDGAFASQVLNAEFTKANASQQDCAQATALVYGCLRNVKSLDWSLSKLASLKKTPLPVLVALRIGAFDILYQSTPDYAACNEAVSLIAQEQLRKFVNAVLRKLIQKRIEVDEFLHDSPTLTLEDLEVKTSVPKWILEDLRSSMLTSMDDLSAWAATTSSIPNLTLRIQPSIDENAIIDSLQKVGVRASPVQQLKGALTVDVGTGKVSDLPGFAFGHWTVQDLGAQLVALMADPPQSGIVLDLCSAPGGKTTHLAELMADKGKVFSIELHKGKSKLVEEARKRLNLSSVEVHVADAKDTKAVQDIISSHVVDAVVLDAPCSGTGTLRRNPEHRLIDSANAWKKLKSLTSLQDELLDAAAKYVRPGGTLTYSVCSVMSAETDERVAAFLQRHAGSFSLVKPIMDSRLQSFVSDSATLGERSCIRTWTHLHPADGHFIAKMVKTSSI